jgi:arylamine N-acetyltransferase
MAFDEMADRIRKIVSGNKAVSETRMFGGLCFMLNGNMQICARRDGSILARVGTENAAKAIGRHGVERMVMRGREMADYLFVAADAAASEKALREWVEMTGAYVAALPPKAAKAKKR